MTLNNDILLANLLLSRVSLAVPNGNRERNRIAKMHWVRNKLYLTKSKRRQQIKYYYCKRYILTQNKELSTYEV